MLESIQINNFAIIEALQLEFGRGMTALTGETGAGKSILLDAIKLISGDRADSDSIKSGEEKADISVCFDIQDGPQDSIDWLNQNSLDSDGECIIRRVLYANGRSKAFINGLSVPLSQLRELTQMLVDIHGQHEHQSLQQSKIQLQLLDSYLGEASLLKEVRSKYEHWHLLQTRLADLKSGSHDREQRIDLLQLYCQELNELNLSDNEIEVLQTDYQRLSHAGQLLESVGMVLAMTYDNDESTIQSQLSYCQQILAEQLEYDPKLGSSHELLNSALIQIQEASSELRDYHGSIDIDAEHLDYLNQRIAHIQELARKHRVNAEALPGLRDSLNQELEELLTSEEDIDSLKAARQGAAEEYLFNARELSVKRRQTAESLSVQITEVMQQLGMQGGRFCIQLEDIPEDTGFRRDGIDQVSYLVSANPGQPLKPLNRVASGGELSRISLAIQVILSESSLIPTLIFDEVDAGIGGGIAEIVGSKLRQLGNNRQIFCVTHLPQVASQAHRHYRVEKDKREDNTSTHVVALTEKERLEEVARMLGGVTITEQALAHAGEMIASSNQINN